MSHVCINCGSDKVERQGDDFTCLKCQFHWDVALEQANKVYLRSQGRQPAVSILAEPEPSLPSTLGQDGPATMTNGTPTPVPPDQKSGEAVPPTPEKPAGKGKATSA